MTTQVPPDLLQTPYRKNVIINGNFDVWQRGTSFAAVADSAYSADRWKYAKAGAVVHTITQDTDVPTYAQSGIKSSYSLKMDVTTADASLAAGDLSGIRYNIEGYDLKGIWGGNATLSFWVKGAKTGVHCVAFRNSGASRSYIAEYSITTANTWEKKTITVPLNEGTGTWLYTNGIGMEVFFTLSSGTTYHTTKDAWQTGNYIATSSQVNETDNTANNFFLAQVQFEKGDVATPLEYRGIAEELAMCQRYFTSVGAVLPMPGYSSSSNNFTCLVTLPVQLRANPTLSNPTSYSLFIAGSAYTVTASSPTKRDVGLSINFTGTFTHNNYAGMVRPNGGSMWIDAEL